MARIPDAVRESFPEDIRYVWDRNVSDGATGTPANIHLAMANNPRVFHNYLRLGNALWNHCGLDVRTRELAILRCAILRHSVYEWHQHVRIGRAAGVKDAEINALHHWHESDLFTPAEKAFFAYLDALAETDHPSRQVFDQLSEHFPAAAIVGITLLGAYYFATAKFLGALEVPTEEAFVGWEVRLQ